MTIKDATTSLKGVLAFTSVYMLAAIVGAVVQRNHEFVLYTGVMLVLIGVVIFVNWRAPLPEGILWGLSVWGLLHMAGGLVPLPVGWPYHGEYAVFYSWWIVPETLKYDQVVHMYGCGLVTILCWDELRTGLRRADHIELKPTLGLMTLCAAAGAGFGALNEVVEYVAVRTLPATNVGGYENTSLDLISNTVGAVGAVILIRIRYQAGIVKDY